MLEGYRAGALGLALCAALAAADGVTYFQLWRLGQQRAA
jgi:hypothetical protein